MSSVEKIKDEYMLFEADGFPEKEISSKVVLDVFIGDMEETIRSSRVAVRDNFTDEQITKVKNFFLDLAGYDQENVEQFDEDSKVVMRISCLAERYKGYFDRMMESVNSDNFADIYKLAFFTYNCFTSNYHYLESLRDGIRFAVDGVTYYGSGEDSQGEFSEFFEEVFPIVVGKEKVYKKVEV